MSTRPSMASTSSDRTGLFIPSKRKSKVWAASPSPRWRMGSPARPRIALDTVDNATRELTNLSTASQDEIIKEARTHMESLAGREKVAYERVQSLELERDELLSKMEDLKESHQRRIQILMDTIEAGKKHMPDDELQHLLQEKNDEIEQLRTRLDHVDKTSRSQMVVLEDQLADVQAKLSRASLASSTSVSEKNAELQALQNDLKMLEKTANATIDRLQSELKAKEDDLDALHQEIRTLRGQIDDAAAHDSHEQSAKDVRIAELEDQVEQLEHASLGASSATQQQLASKEAQLATKDKQLAAKDNHIAQLERQVAELQDAAIEKKGHDAQATHTIDRLERELSDKEQETRKLQDKLRDKEQETRKLQDDLSDKEQETQRLQDDLDAKNNQVVQLEAHLAQADEQVVQLDNHLRDASNASEKQLAVKTAQVTRLEKLVEQLHDQVAQLSVSDSEMVAKNAEIDALKQQLDRLSVDKSWAKTHMDQVEAQLAAAEQRASKHHRDVVALEAEVAAKDEELRALEQHVAHLDRDRKALETRLAQAQSKSLKMIEKDERISDLEAAMSNMGVQLQEMAQTLHRLQDERVDKDNQLAELEREREQLDNHVRSLQASLDQLHARDATRARQLKDKHDYITRIEKKHAATLADLDEWIKYANEGDDRIKIMDQEIRSLQASAAMVEERSARIDQLEVTIQSISAELAKAIDHRHHMGQKFTELLSDLSQWKDQADHLFD